MKLSMYMLWVVGGSLDFGPCTGGWPELNPVGRDDSPRAGCMLIYTSLPFNLHARVEPLRILPENFNT